MPHASSCTRNTGKATTGRHGVPREAGLSSQSSPQSPDLLTRSRRREMQKSTSF